MSNSRQFCKYIINSSADKLCFLNVDIVLFTDGKTKTASPVVESGQHDKSISCHTVCISNVFIYNRCLYISFAFMSYLFSINALTDKYNVMQYARLPEWVTRQRNSRASRRLVSEIYYLIVWVEVRSLFFVNLFGDNRNWIHTQKRSIACVVTYFHCLVTYHWGKILRKRELNLLNKMTVVHGSESE